MTAGARDADGGGAQTLDAMLSWATRAGSSERATTDGDETTRLRRCLFWAPWIDGVGVEKARAYFDSSRASQMVPRITTGSSATGFSPPTDYTGIPAGISLSQGALSVEITKHSIDGF
jgi:hypothetical protein